MYVTKQKRVAIYARVSTDEPTGNQLRELRQWAERAGHAVVTVFQDEGISGAKGRDRRPGFDGMLKAAVRREFDIVAVWSRIVWIPGLFMARERAATPLGVLTKPLLAELLRVIRLIRRGADCFISSSRRDRTAAPRASKSGLWARKSR